MTMTRQVPGCGTHETSRSTKDIHRACMRNLFLFLQGHISYEDWQSGQEELESRLTPAPELPLSTRAPRTPRTPEAA